MHQQLLATLENAVRTKREAHRAAQEALTTAKEEAHQRVTTALEEALAMVSSAQLELDSSSTAESSARRHLAAARRQHGHL